MVFSLCHRQIFLSPKEVPSRRAFPNKNWSNLAPDVFLAGPQDRTVRKNERTKAIKSNGGNLGTLSKTKTPAVIANVQQYLSEVVYDHLTFPHLQTMTVLRLKGGH